MKPLIFHIMPFLIQQKLCHHGAFCSIGTEASFPGFVQDNALSGATKEALPFGLLVPLEDKTT